MQVGSALTLMAACISAVPALCINYVILVNQTPLLSSLLSEARRDSDAAGMDIKQPT
jgi:hypothetical protein